MLEKRSCPECGTSLPSDAPAGLCPRCLLGAGIPETADFAPRAASRTGSADVANYEVFRASLLRLGLAEESDLDGLEAEAGTDVSQLAKALVKRGKLTPYQAGALAQGKAKGLVIGRYLILDKLGMGGMGVVFRARHQQTRQVVALKILPPSFARDREAVRRFRREFQVASHLKHPNLVAAIEADEDRGVHFLTMDYILGRDLETLVHEDGPLDVKLALHCVIQVARGLEAAHAQGVIHRDIKPSNVMIDAAGNVRVLDLGLARVIEATSNLAQEMGGSLTQTGAYMGSVDYLAPEQADDAKRADHRADIYSLGCTLHYLLTGQPPFPESTILKRLIAHQERPAPSLRAARPQVSARLDAIYERMMAKKPGDRPQSMSEVIAALEACRANPREAGDASADLKSFATTFMKRAPMKKRGLDSSVFVRPQEFKGLRFDPDLKLEDLIHDYKDEKGHEEVPEEKLPPALPRTKAPKPRRARRRGVPPWVPGLFFGLAGAAVVYFAVRPKPEDLPKNGETRDSGAMTSIPAPPEPPRPPARSPIREFRMIDRNGVETPSVVAPYLAISPKPDGVIRPGEYGTLIPVNFEAGSPYGKLLRGMPDPATRKSEDDLSFDILAAYTDRALHMAFQVRDQFIDASESDRNDVHMNDCIELFLDGDGAPNDFVMAGGRPTGSREGFQILADAAGQPVTIASDFRNSDWKAGARTTADGYVVEFEIPLELIDTVDGEGRGAPGPGSLIRLGMAVDDFDNDRNAARAFGYLQARDGVGWPFGGREPAWAMGVLLEAPTASTNVEDSSGFVSMFNGRDLTGWKTHPSQPTGWRVENGLLIGSGTLGHLYSERGDYTDFELRCEVRVNASGNSGVHFRTPFGPTFPTNSPRFPEGYEASIYWGAQYPKMQTGTLYCVPRGVLAEVSNPPGSAGTWVTVRVTARENRTVVEVDGKIVVDHVDTGGGPGRGHIALQCHDANTVAEFRKIEIRELKDEGRSVAATAKDQVQLRLPSL